MSRRLQVAMAALTVGLLATSSIPAAAAGNASIPTASAAGITVVAPRNVVPGRTTAVTVKLPAGVAAVEGRIFVDDAAAEVVGVAPLGTGQATRPVRDGDGYAFAAYGLTSVNGHTTLRVVVFPKQAGTLQVRVAIDSTADSVGRRLATGRSAVLSAVGVGSRAVTFHAPLGTPAPLPLRLAGPAREFVRDGRINAQDVDAVRAEWYVSHQTGAVCGRSVGGDANADGCIDAVDLQAEYAAQGQRTAAATAVAASHTFTVNSSADTADATNGDGICADTLGRCTLRAAMTEADWIAGDDRIEFNIPGPAPVTIQLASRLPNISSRAGTLTIDGYTQPGSRVNTAAFGSNAIMGVEIRGNGTANRDMALYITSAGNTIRGLLINNFYNGVFVDQAGAHDNRIVGNWIGFTKTGAAGPRQNFAVVFNNGANHNFDGSPALADRNVIGNVTHAEENFGAGTDFNTTQNNLMCVGPTGTTTARCSTGIDHNFGPKNHLIGGTGTNERNIIGPTDLQGIEFSHGWDQNGHVYSTQYGVNNNQAVGNWVGFRGDGSYNAAYRSGQQFSSADNGQGINVYDGSNFNTVDGNYVASVYDGVQIMSPNATGNIVRNNIIGVSPLGEAAPLTGWGVVVRWGSVNETVDSNVIRNATKGGFGLLNTMNTGSATSVAYNVRLTKNIVSDTSGPAIALFGNADDNTHLPAPAITSALTSSVTGTAIAGTRVELFRASRGAGQVGLPVEFLGAATTAGNGRWTISASVNADDNVTALQIRPDGNTSQLAQNVTVGQGPVNHAPVFNNDLGDRTSAERDVINVSAAATDADGDALTYSATNLPAGISIDASSGQISGTLTYNSSGTYAVVVSVNDGKATVTDSFTWNVSNTNRLPVATVTITPKNPDTNTTLTATATAADADGDAVSLTYVWKVNGSVQRTFTSGSVLTDTFDLSQAGNGDNGDVVRVEVTPNDGSADGATVNDQVTVVDPAIYASDHFSRTVAGGWGSAGTGGAYTLQGAAADYAVNGSVGSISDAAGLNRSAILAGVSQSDVDLSLRFALDKVTVGGGQFVYGVVRRISSNTEYRARVRLAANGMVYVGATALVAGAETDLGSEVRVAGLTVSPNSYFNLRVQASGTSPTTIRVRIWAAGSAEPTTWQFTGTDSSAALQAPGGVGIRTYTAGGVTNGPIQVSVDDILAAQIQ